MSSIVGRARGNGAVVLVVALVLALVGPLFAVTPANAQEATRARVADFDGDGDTDVAVFRPSSGMWHVLGADPVLFGQQPGDLPLPADYDGDGITDVAIFRSGMWLVRGAEPVSYGSQPGDVPLPADYDGDGDDDVAVFRSGLWFVRGQGDPVSYGSQPGDVPLPADYDGDGDDDFAVFRSGMWFVRGQQPVRFGSQPGDVPLPGDYDGDGTADLAVFRPSTGMWFVRGQEPVVYGSQSGDLPMPGDYDGDGAVDIAIFRSGTWLVRGAAAPVVYGTQPGDVALPLHHVIRDRYFSTPTPANSAPTIAAIAAQSVQAGEAFTLQASADDVDGDPLSFSAVGLPEGLTIDADGAISGASTVLGEHQVTVTVSDGTDTAQTAFTLTLTEAPAPVEPCSPYSTLPCGDLEVTVPFALDFDADHGGLADADGQGTGFTLADPPSAPLSTPSNPAVPGYEPSKLDLDTTAGVLEITSTNGIMFSQPSASTNTNSQVNGLAVAVDAKGGVTTVETTVRNPSFPTSANSEQMGLWFGTDEANYAKVGILNAGSGRAKIQLNREINNISVGANDEVNSVNFTGLTTEDVRLVLVADAGERTLIAKYQIGSAAEVTLGTLTDMPASFFDGETVEDGSELLARAGLYTTHRRGSTPITAIFDGFAVDVVTPGTPVNAAPVITAIEDQSIEVGAAFELQVEATDSDGDALTYSAEGLPAGLTIDAAGNIAGTVGTAAVHAITVTVSDGTEEATAGFTLTVTEPAPAGPCTPYSPLPCADVAVGDAHDLSWAADEGGLDDKDGEGTGFTMLQPSSNGGEYLPANLDVDPVSGDLTITTTNGIQYKTAASTTNGNSLDNGLGVGVNSAGRVTTMETTVINPSARGNNSEQGGIWFGRDEDNYVKLVVAATGTNSNRVQLLREIGGVAGSADEVNRPNSNLTAAQVHLRLVVDATASTATAYYSIDGATELLLGELSLPAGFFDAPAPAVPGVSGFAGLFATHRNATTPTTFRFADWSVSVAGDPANTAPVLTSPGARTVLEDEAIEAIDVQATDVDGDGLTFSASGLPAGLTIDPATGIISGTPEAGSAATYQVSVTVTDDGEPAASDTVMFSITVALETPAFSAKVNFSDDDAVLPTGYLRDHGQGYAARTGGDQGALTYGWVVPGTSTPLDLSTGGTTPGNGRDRDLNADQRLDTLMHMQADDISGTFNGTATEGAWEIEVAQGTYQVTVAAGDPSVNDYSQDPELHTLRVEGVTAIDQFAPTGLAGSATHHRTATVSATVLDGKLTIDAVGGTNTKINYVDIVASGTAEPRPFVTAVRPADGATGVALNGGVATDVHLVEVGMGVDPATLTADTVILTKVSDGTEIAANRGTSGGTDVITLQPLELLEPNTTYRFTVTDGAKDQAGNAFLPFTSTFTTGTGDTQTPTDVQFEQVSLPTASGAQFTTLVMGPDDKLYASTNAGQIWRFDVAQDGTLGTPQKILTIQAANGGSRLLVGMAFDPASTADNLILWTSHTFFGVNNMPDWGGKITKLTGPNLETATDVVTNLPRSYKDHVSNSVAFGPDGALYMVQGSNSAGGAPDGAWGNRSERLLTAAVLRIDTDAISGTLNVKTEEGGTYDPYAPGAPVKVYASGIRNAYDLVWHSNGQLYVPTNGTAGGSNAPATPATLPDACNTRRIDLAENGPYTGPQVPGISSNVVQRDLLFRVEQGGYYGHPNPSRCEFAYFGGNPTAGNDGLTDQSRYPVGTLPDRNYRGFAYSFEYNKSPNGAIEYKSNTFGGALKGKLLVSRFSNMDDLEILTPGGPNLDIIDAQDGAEGMRGFVDPLDVVEDTRNGNLYVSEYGWNSPGSAKLTLLRPEGQAAMPNVELSQSRLVFDDVVGGAATAAKTVMIRNTGDAALSITGVTVGGADAAQFAVSGAPAAGSTIAAGASATVSVTFNAASAGTKGATINVATNDPDTAQATVALRGLGEAGVGGSNEPSLQRILDTWEIPVWVGDDNAATNVIHGSTPTAAKLGEEIEAQRFVRASDGPVTIEPLSVYGPTSHNPVTAFGWYPAGNPATLNQVFSVSNSPADNGQTLTPAITGTLSFDPGTAPFGVYSLWPAFANRNVFGEDALNTWDSANKHHVRVYPLKSPTGAVVPDAYVVATEEHTSGNDFQDVTVILRNVRAAASAEAEIEATPELVFSGVVNTTSAAKIVEVSNTGDAPLTITGASLTGANATAFTLAGGNPSLPATVAPGGTASFGVTFTPSTTGPLSAALRLSSDDRDEPTLDVGLYGLATPGLEGGNEPTLHNVVNTLGHPINVGWTTLASNTVPTLKGDEALAQYFVKAGSGPVTITPVARYSPNEVLPFGWYTLDGGNPTHRQVASIASGQHQALYPQIAAGGASSFDPGTASFGVYVDSMTFNRKSYQLDDINTGGAERAARVYPLKDRSGSALANTYLVAFEDAANGDYQDYVFRLTNVRPSTGGSSGPAFSSKVNFQPDTAAVPEGYVKDIGAGFDATRGYGWVAPGTSTPVDKTADTRLRIAPSDPRLQTLIIMENDAVAAVVPGSWEHAVPNGSYEVTVTAGDGDYLDSTHRVLVEGQVAIDSFAPTAAEPFTTATVTVTVSDGRLTVSAGGDNSKITNVDIAGEGTSQPAVAGKVNFQLASAPTPTGYTADTGAAFDATRGFGWVQPGSSTPVDMTANTRERTTPASGVQKTLVIMTDSNIRADGVDGTWDHVVPNGTYEVTVGVGDGDFYDSVHKVAVEGQVVVDSFTPSVSDPFKVSTATVTVADGRLTVTDVGTNSKLTHIEFSGGGLAVPDETDPTVEVALSGVTDTTGAYKNAARVTITAADLGGSGLQTVAYSLDGGAFQAYTGPLDVTEAGDHTVTGRAVDRAGNVTTSAAKAFEVVIPPPSRAEIEVQNLDGVPSNDRLTFSRIGSVTSPPTNGVHDLVTLRIRNTGVEPLDIVRMTIDGTDKANWVLESAPTLPTVVAPNTNLDVQVRFVAAANRRVHNATLTIASNDVDEPATVVQLGGWWQSVSEGGQEPDLQDIVEAFGWTTQVVGSGEQLNRQGLHEAVGEEVLSAYWKRADTSKPVTVRQLAAFHTYPGTASLYWHAKGSNTTSTIMTHLGQDAQSLLPHKNNGTQGSGAFSPSAVFGWKIDPEWSDHTKNNGAIDISNGCDGATAADCGHHMRFWPVKDAQGDVVPATYMMWMDYSGINYDYNDNGYLVTNVVPEDFSDTTAPAAPTGLTATASSSGIALDWDASTEADLGGYLVYRSGTANGTYTKLTASPVTASAYTDAAAPAGATSHYQVTAVDAFGNESVFATASATRPEGPAPSPDAIRINTGGTAQTVGGVTWQGCASATACNGYATGGFPYSENDTVTGIQAPANNALYQSEWTGGASGPTGSVVPVGSTAFAFDVPVANGDYMVRLHFAELNKDGAGLRTFDVNLEGGAKELTNFDIWSEASGIDKAIVREFPVSITDGDVTVEFVRQVENAKISGIEIIPVEDSSSQVIARINAGGPAVTTGGVSWSADQFFSGGKSYTNPSVTDIAGTPDDVLYTSEHSATSNLGTFGYAIPVPASGTYTVRLHFAEIYWGATGGGAGGAGQRVFSANVEGGAVELADYDINAEVGAMAASVKTYTATVTDGMLDIAFSASVNQPKVSAIEVLGS